MALMGLSLSWPPLSSLSIPCLVMTGLSYGLGVGPAAYVLMSTIFTQRMKSTGLTTGQVVKAIMVTLQLKVMELSVVLRDTELYVCHKDTGVK